MKHCVCIGYTVASVSALSLLLWNKHLMSKTQWHGYADYMWFNMVSAGIAHVLCWKVGCGFLLILAEFSHVSG